MKNIGSILLALLLTIVGVVIVFYSAMLLTAW